MKVMVVGGGGREHALCWKLAQSPLVDEVLCAPGNPGSAQVARNLNISASDQPGMVSLAQSEGVGLVVIGPEDPLCEGLADRLRAVGIPVFGPGAVGAQLEGSKAFSKAIVDRHRIPTAASKVFDRSGLAKSTLDSCTSWPQVIKADGLAAGKGVYICEDLAQARSAVDSIMEERRHGSAGEKILIEEFLEGDEVSVFAITDGETVLIMECAQDHKRVGDGDTGPNTGGMGVKTPVASVTRRLHKQIEQHVLLPTVHALRHEGIPFRGVLFCGLMLTEGGPRLLEYNVRFGDPECEVLMRRLKGDLFPILLAAAEGRLGDISPPEWDPRVCVGVVAAAEGYPSSPRKGDAIHGLEQASAVEGVEVFHAGTRSDSGGVYTNGGRVLCVTAMGDDVEQARERAYEAVDLIEWDGKFCRRDIGLRIPKADAADEGETASAAEAPGSVYGARVGQRGSAPAGGSSGGGGGDARR